VHKALVRQQQAQQRQQEELARSLDQEFWGVHTEVIKSTHKMEVGFNWGGERVLLLAACSMLLLLAHG
jgi:hypothetical protein